MCVALVGLCASAQEKGDMALGLNLGVAPCLESGASLTNFGIGAKFQYNVTNPIRLEAALDYGFKSNGIDVMTIGVNGHYIFNVSEKFNFYPLVGGGFAHLGGGGMSSDIEDIMNEMEDLLGDSAEDYGDMDSGSSSANKFFFNIGAGAEYAVNEKFSVGAELKYQYIKDFSRLPITVGVTYKF